MYLCRCFVFYFIKLYYLSNSGLRVPPHSDPIPHPWDFPEYLLYFLCILTITFTDVNRPVLGCAEASTSMDLLLVVDGLQWTCQHLFWHHYTVSAGHHNFAHSRRMSTTLHHCTSSDFGVDWCCALFNPEEWGHLVAAWNSCSEQHWSKGKYCSQALFIFVSVWLGHHL